MPTEEKVLPIRKEIEEPASVATFSQPVNVETPLYKQRFFFRAATGSATANRQGISLTKNIAAFSTVTTVSTATHGTTETNLATIILQKPEIDLVGRAIRITALGTYTADTTRTVTLRIGSGTAPTTEWNSIVSTAATATSQPWNLTWYGIVVTTGSSGTLEGQLIGSINNVSKNDPNTATVTVSTVGSLTIALTAQWSATDTGNSVTIRQWFVDLLN